MCSFCGGGLPSGCRTALGLSIFVLTFGSTPSREAHTLRRVKPLPIFIDRASPVPVYHQLSEQLTAAITEGQLKPGDAFENELDLAARLSLSRPTVRRAIGELVDRGLLVRRRGVGTTVASQMVHRRDELTSLHEDLLRKGRQPTTRVLATDPARPNPVAAEALGLPADTPLVYVERVRFADDTPTAILANWLPPEFAGILEDDLAEEGLYALLRLRGVKPVIAHQTIGARRPTPRERKLLGLGAGDPLLTMSRRAFAADGSPVEFGDHCYRFDQYAFDVTVHER